MAEHTPHTPTPWELVMDNKRYPGIDGGDNYTVIIFGNEHEECGVRGVTHEQAIANAAFIVRAANSHDALVKALADALEEIGKRRPNGEVVKRCRTALSLAQPEGK